MAEETFQAIEQQLRWLGALFEQKIPILRQQVAALRVDFRALRADLVASDLEEENRKPITTLSTEGEGFKSFVLEEETKSEVAARIMEHVTEETKNARLPSSPLPSSPEVMVQETLSQVAAMPSSLSLLVENNSCASKTKIFEEAQWQDLGSIKVTWLSLVHVEKSNLQLSPICSKGQMYFDLGFSFEENSPSLFLQLGLKRFEYRSDRMLQNWLSFFQCSPTQSLLHTWFRGELINMLFGSGLDLLLLFVQATNK